MNGNLPDVCMGHVGRLLGASLTRLAKFGVVHQLDAGYSTDCAEGALRATSRFKSVALYVSGLCLEASSNCFKTSWAKPDPRDR
mmetsp:Transcript_73402/g.122657  ORF Transcript_73402/g.122657 Transcript_73402/m.122657 type:complete len:84 (-) Transcript_73402:785-1036(-)